MDLRKIRLRLWTGFRIEIAAGPLLSNGYANKHVSTAREHSNNGRDLFYAVLTEML
jgi:hypothetical protein